jgi:mannose-6-phosphate isomerase-like protein (cupin superfamily)
MDTTESNEGGQEPRGAEKKETFHQAAEAEVHTFSFKRPDVETPGGRIECRLAATDSCRAIIEVLKKDWSGSLHYHPNQDGIWMVLKGRVRFHGPDGIVRGEFGPYEGLLQPENSRYWFECIGDEEVWLMQISGFPKGPKDSKRITLDPAKAATIGASAKVDLSGKGPSTPVISKPYKELTG